MVLIPSNNTVGITIVFVGALFGFLATVVVGLRLWARKLQGTRIDASDWACIFGLVFGLALVGGTVNTVVQGLGLPIEDVTPKQLENLAKGLLLGIFLWTLSSTAVRVSMTLLYLRLFRSRKFHLVCWIYLVENVTSAITILITACAICQPFAYHWNKLRIQGHCGNETAFYTFMGIHNLVADVVLILLPIPQIWSLQMRRSKKISLSLMFGMGFGICGLTTARIIESTRATEITRDYAPIGILSLLEPLLGVVNCSLPLLRPILVFFKGKSNSEGNDNPQHRRFLPPNYSIGSKWMRKAHELYPLESTVNITETGRTETMVKASNYREDANSLTGLTHGSNADNIILVRNEFDVVRD